MRLIDADALMQNIPNEEMIAKMAVAHAPSIDIVRCKECKWKDTFKCWMRNTQVPRYPNADDFCSYGERKESE